MLLKIWQEICVARKHDIKFCACQNHENDAKIPKNCQILKKLLPNYKFKLQLTDSSTIT